MIRRALIRWVAFAQARAVFIVLLALLGGAGLVHTIVGHLEVDTNSENLLSPKLPWRQASAKLDAAFPKLNNTLAVVIDGAGPEQLDDAQARLVTALRAHPEWFDEVFAYDTDPYFRRNGLLFLEPEPLQALADQLVQAQPFLGTLDQDPSLRALFTLLSRAADSAAAEGFDLSPAFGAIAKATEAASAGRSEPLSWQGLIGDSGSLAGKRRFIELTAKLDYEQLLPAQAPIEGLRATVRELGLDRVPGLRVRLTGSVAMEHDEIATAFNGAGWALGLAMALSAGLLLLALRSVKLVVAAVVTLVYGLLATTAFAALAIGHLNLISVAFGVLYVGLGLDYALYLGMQYRERLGRGDAPANALADAAGDVGGYMAVCAATCSLGFLAFVPTPFTGIAELGVISGAGMAISLVLSLTLLPALIALLKPDPAILAWTPTVGGSLQRVLAWPYAHARTIWIATGALVLVAVLLLPRAHFDADPLNLRDQKSEALTTFRELMRDPDLPTLTMSALAPDEATAKQLAEAGAQQPTVARALTLADFVPTQQPDKLAILSELIATLGPALALGSAPAAPLARDDDAAALDALRTALPVLIAKSDGASGEAAKQLAAALDGFAVKLAAADAAGREQLLAGLRANLLNALPSRLAGLKQALAAGPVTMADLPPALVERWRSADGQWRVEFQPRAVLATPEIAQAFIDDVHRAAPGATGAPLSQNEAGRAVVRAFQQAFASALVVIALLLFVLLRSLLDTVLVLVPLLVAGLLTAGGSVLFGMPFNFANVIALPLILGVGVDYGVYLVQRGRDAADGTLLRTGTARAVLYGALITMVNFGNLIFARHPGMVSMGALLTLGLAVTLLAALVLLPSLLAWRWRHAHPREPASFDQA